MIEGKDRRKTIKSHTGELNSQNEVDHALIKSSGQSYYYLSICYNYCSLFNVTFKLFYTYYEKKVLIFL